MSRLARALGWTPHPWQDDLWRVALTLNESGTGWQYTTFVVSTPRRSGKTRAVTGAKVHRGLAFPRSRCWYTAQTGQDARDLFRDLVTDLGSTPLAGRFRSRFSAGSETITWGNGSTFRTFSPQPDALHGKDTDFVTVDESWTLSAERGGELLQAIRPSMLTRPWRSLWFPSTAGTDESTFLRDMVDRARASVDDPDTRIGIVEYACPPDLDPLDPESWPLFHPAYGRTVTRDALEGELDVMGQEGFARAYGNVWPSSNASGWSAATLERCATTDAPGDPVVIGVDVSTDRTRGSVVVVGPAPDGVPVVEVVDLPALMDLPRVVAAVAGATGGTVVVNPYGPAVTLPDDLTRLGVTFTETGTADYAAACAGMFDAVTAGTVRLRPDPDLTAACLSAGRRRIGDRWAWARTGSVDVSPLTAATLALWGHTRPPEPAMPAPAWFVPET